MKRRLFTALSVLSLLLCVATLALWARSYWRVDNVFYVPDAWHWYAAGSNRGQIGVSSGQGSDASSRGLIYGTGPSDRTTTLTLQEWNERVATNMRSWWLLGLGFAYDGGPSRFRGIGLPHWCFALLFAILPALHLHATIRSRRLRRTGHCPRCGYDLRATPARCPECGAVPAATPAR